MASIRKHKTGWRVEVQRNGVRKSKVFGTKIEARDWALRVENDLRSSTPSMSKLPMASVFDRYAREISPAKRGARWEMLQLERLAKNGLGAVRICDVTPERLGQWRDERLRLVSAGTVRREMVLLSHVFNVARREWGLLASNPMSDVRRPPEPPPRDRLPTDAEIERLIFVAGDDLNLAQARAVHAFRFAIETAMRAGEIVGLTWSHIDLSTRVAALPKTKNGTARQVPLSTEAIALLEALPQADPVFGLRSDQLDAMWRKMRKKAAIDGLNFHDSRHAAITQLARKLDVLDLARMTGHRDIRQLLVYYNAPASELAKRLH